LAALERGVVLHARDLGKLKTWSQAVAAGIGGFAAAGAWRHDIAWWALLVAVVLTWVSGLDYARVAPRVWRGGAVAPSSSSDSRGRWAPPDRAASPPHPRARRGRSRPPPVGPGAGSSALAGPGTGG